MSALQEIAAACRDAPKEVYREEGLAVAIAFVVVMPIAVPIAALFYYSIEENYREILEEDPYLP